MRTTERPQSKPVSGLMQWIVESSHMILVPVELRAYTLDDLRSQVQAIADSKTLNPVGEIFYRYELDYDERARIVHCYFQGRDGRRKRFMRLRRL